MAQGAGSGPGVQNVESFVGFSLHRAHHLAQGGSVSFGLYLFGFILVIAGVAWGLVVAGVRPLYVIISCLILLGIAVMTGVSRTRSRDQS
jgi:hypothetical protein